MLRCARTISHVVMTFFLFDYADLSPLPRHVTTITPCHSSFHDQQRCHIIKQRQRQRHHVTRQMTTTMMPHRDGGEGGYGQVVGPNNTCLGQVCFFFLSFFIFTNNIYCLCQQAHGPTLVSKASWWAVLWHPCYKCESVGFSSIIQHTNPPSLQTRVGGLFLCSQTTLATMASRWGLTLYYSCRIGPNARCLGL
jgi:hypothetical protein